MQPQQPVLEHVVRQAFEQLSHVQQLIGRYFVLLFTRLRHPLRQRMPQKPPRMPVHKDEYHERQNEPDYRSKIDDVIHDANALRLLFALVSPYLARWAQYGLHAPYWLRQYGLCVALLPPAIRALVSPYLARWAQYGLRAPYWLRQYGLCVALSRPLGSIRAPFNTHNAPNTSLQPLRAPLALGAFAFHALKLYETPMPLPLRAPLALGAFAFHALKLYETPMPLPLRG